MQGRRPTGRVRVTLLAAALALALVAAATLPAAVAGQSDEASIATEGREVVVEVDQSVFDGVQTNNVTLTVTAADASTAVEAAPENDGPNVTSYTYQFGFEAIELDRSMAVTELEASVNGTPITNRTLDLRRFAFGPAGDARFADDGGLLVPVEEAYGLGGSVSLQVDDDGEVQAAIEDREDGEYAVVARDAVLSHALAFEDGSVTLAPQPSNIVTGDTDEVPVDVRTMAERRSSVAVADDRGGLVVTSPLVFPNRAYNVSATNGTGPNAARFAGSASSSGDRTLPFGTAELAAAESVAVTLRRNGAVVLETNATLASAATGLDASVAGDNTSIQVNASELDGGLPENFERAVVNNSTEWQELNAGAINVSEGGLIDLSATNLSLAPTGGYGFLLVGEDGTVVRATLSGEEATGLQDGGNTTDDDEPPSEQEGLLASLLQWITANLLIVGIIVALFVVSAAVVYVVTGRRSSGGSSGRGSGGGGTAPQGGQQRPASRQPVDVGVEVVDESSDQRIDANGQLAAEPGRGNNETRRSADLSGGRARLQLSRGRWRLTARGENVNVAEDVRVTTSTTLTLRVTPNEVTVEVLDDETGDPVPDAEVACRPGGGDADRERTDRTGRVAFEVPPDAGSVEVGARHDRYEERTENVRVGSKGGSSTLRLRPLTGGVRSTVTVDGRQAAGVPVEVHARDSYVKRHRDDVHRSTTDRQGSVRVDGLLAGSYEVRVAFPEGRQPFTAPTRMVEVRDGGVEAADLDVEFTYSVDSGHRGRMEDLRDRLDSLSASTGRDVVVPRYYASVVVALLDVAERLPAEGHRFAGADVRPDELVAALLDAAEAATDAVSTAMSSKRNGDLFTACSDLPDRQVTWQGSFDVADLFELVEGGRGQSSSRLQGRVATVEDRIADEQGELATLSPAREPLDEVTDLVREARRDDDRVYAAAVAFAAEGLLDAVEGVMDQEELRKRLQRTVF